MNSFLKEIIFLEKEFEDGEYFLLVLIIE